MHSFWPISRKLKCCTDLKTQGTLLLSADDSLWPHRHPLVGSVTSAVIGLRLNSCFWKNYESNSIAKLQKKSSSKTIKMKCCP